MSRYYTGATDERRANLAAIDAMIATAETIRTDSERCEDHKMAFTQSIVANTLRSLRKQILAREIEKPPERSELDRQAWVAAMEAVAQAKQ